MGCETGKVWIRNSTVDDHDPFITVGQSVSEARSAPRIGTIPSGVDMNKSAWLWARKIRLLVYLRDFNHLIRFSPCFVGVVHQLTRSRASTRIATNPAVSQNETFAPGGVCRAHGRRHRGNCKEIYRHFPNSETLDAVNVGEISRLCVEGDRVDQWDRHFFILFCSLS